MMTDDFCRHLIKKFENDPNKHAGRIGNNLVDINIKKTTDLHVDQRVWHREYQHLDMVLSNGFGEYMNYIINDVRRGNTSVFNSDLIATAYQLQKYGVGDCFNWHNDDVTKSKRMVAFIIYLNTLDQDSGGETQFWNGKSIRPTAGKVLFFPATWSYVHRGAEVKKGFKYIITGFMEEVL